MFIPKVLRCTVIKFLYRFRKNVIDFSHCSLPSYLAPGAMFISHEAVAIFLPMPATAMFCSMHFSLLTQFGFGKRFFLQLLFY